MCLLTASSSALFLLESTGFVALLALQRCDTTTASRVTIPAIALDHRTGHLQAFEGRVIVRLVRQLLI